eukprot:CAMPEP_0170543394 /NCGR_PEP_ID=MMETSP0211-20121228/2515_1 /TAXON_ID=311385 /ORGANISM="Pseudokeronopsis sp., Strain OXSARD2" /LENGTH=101 /DNA_ID=CAMNT_0010846743 /DNA_START=1179 /DNA_END=1484 /DNA_ORIENTATION=-
MTYCMKCQKEYHYNSQCSQGANQAFPLEEAKQKKQCPKCKFWVERKQKKTILNCRCGRNFCFFCGKINCSYKNYDCPSNIVAKPGGGFGDLEKMKKNYWDN